jgi:hypothetical protein
MEREKKALRERARINKINDFKACLSLPLNILMLQRNSFIATKGSFIKFHGYIFGSIVIGIHRYVYYLPLIHNNDGSKLINEK